MSRRFLHFLYNLDRALASLIGAPPQETLSSWLFGRRRDKDPLARAGCDVLDAIDPNHCADAITHADRLNAADDGHEQ